MRSIKDFLLQYANLLRPHESTRILVSKTLETVCGVTVPPEKIEYKNKTIYINSSSAVKSVVFVNKKAILEALQQEPGVYIHDIR